MIKGHMMQKNDEKKFDKIHAQQMKSIVPHKPKTGHYVETYGCFNAATTPVVRGSLRS